jgi:transposase
MKLMLSIFLEKRTTKTNTNSSKPSSQTEEDRSAISKPRTKRKGKQETSQAAENSRTIETIAVLPVYNCEQCGQSLEKIPCESVERRTRIDIAFEKTVGHIDAQIKVCPICQYCSKARHPSSFSVPLQYSNDIKAYIIQLIISQMVALNRVQKMVKTLIGHVISESSMLRYIMRLHLALGD